MASTIRVSNETRSASSRITKEGKKITYSLTVIQQPMRARACGSGAKSSADRRPVDPPPIVELKILEGENAQNDITFSYNANFFLFATLENARTIAQGRVATTNTSFPVLTGTPVAGMAYLDRPNPAGFFIFPDLSVRHEGKYRLSFALYEELKDAKDMDNEDPSADPLQAQGNLPAHVSHRLEVKSEPFQVFSAKKFPGLTESTALSRMVAEQGCRVRIRRDVRMRRRDNKGSGNWDEDDEYGALERARRTESPAYGQSPMPTPQPMLDGMDRPRSVSNASNTSYAQPNRRTSLQDMQQNYQNGYAAHMTPQPQSAPYPPQIGYGAVQQQQYQAHYQPQQQPVMQPPQAPFQPPQQPMQMPPFSYPQMPPQLQQPHYEQGAHMRSDSMDYRSPTDYRRQSIAQSQQQYHAANQVSGPFGPMEATYGRVMNPPTQNPHGSMSMPTPTSAHSATGHLLAPLKTQPTNMEKIEHTSPTYPPTGSMATSPDTIQSAYPSESAVPNGKRTFSSTFDTQHMDRPLRQGARPDTNGPAPTAFVPTYADDDDQEPFDERAMSYRRADGSLTSYKKRAQLAQIGLEP